MTGTTPPTEGARQNLLAEGVPDAGITVTGNTGIDALFHVAERLGSDAELAARARECLPRREAGRRLILVTAHRRENFGAGFEQICRALAAIGARDDVEIVFPVHPNPERAGTGAAPSERPAAHPPHRSSGLPELRGGDERRAPDHHGFRRNSGGSADARQARSW